MRAFPDPAKPKEFYLERVRRHREADELIRGIPYRNLGGRVEACAIGCTLECYDHEQYPVLLGVPAILAHLEDFLFENLPEGHLEWPERFLLAIPEGADLSGVYSAWCVRLLDRCLGHIGPGEEPWRIQCRSAVTRVRDRHQDHPRTVDRNQDQSAWEAAEAAARAAAEEAAREAAEEAARAAAEAARAAAEAARPAAEAAREAAWSAAEAAEAAEAAAREAGLAAGSKKSAEWEPEKAAEISKQAEDLLEFLATAPVA